MTAAGSAAARHSPSAGLPPLYSGLLASARRFPRAWLDDFLNDAAGQVASGRSTLVRRYLDAVHAPGGATSSVYAKRKLAEQRALPFGVDEFFLTACVKTRAVVSSVAAEWLFITVPTVDAEVSKLLGIVETALTATAAANDGGAPVLPSAPAVRAVLSALADAATGGPAPPAAALVAAAAVAAAPDSATLLGAVRAARAAWPSAAADRAALWKPFPRGGASAAGGSGDGPSVLLPEVAHPLARDLAAALGAAADGIAAGSLPASEEDHVQVRAACWRTHARLRRESPSPPHGRSCKTRSTSAARPQSLWLRAASWWAAVVSSRTPPPQRDSERQQRAATPRASWQRCAARCAAGCRAPMLLHTMRVLRLRGARLSIRLLCDCPPPPRQWCQLRLLLLPRPRLPPQGPSALAPMRGTQRGQHEAAAAVAV